MRGRWGKGGERGEGRERDGRAARASVHDAGTRQRAITRTGTVLLLLLRQLHRHSRSLLGNDCSTTTSGTCPTTAEQPPVSNTDPMGHSTPSPARPLAGATFAGGRLRVSSTTSIILVPIGGSDAGQSQPVAASTSAVRSSPHERTSAIPKNIPTTIINAYLIDIIGTSIME
jgi:hypothetical protein